MSGLREFGRVGILALAIAVLDSVALGSVPASAHVNQAPPAVQLPMPQPPSPKPTKKKPNTKVALKSWGSTVTSAQQTQRLGRKGKQSEETKTEPSSELRLRNIVPAKRVQRQPFRLNLGICGRRGPDGTTPGPARCQPFEPDTPDPTRRTLPPTVVQPPRPADVTWEQVLAESKDVLFPQLHVKVQPAGRTLVNLDTIVYTDESKVSTETVTLLGFPVVVEATPMSYSWSFGDGSPVLITTSPGKPYPSKEITHKYMKRGSTKITLTTNYAARFNVAGTGWQYVDGTVPITGPATDLLIREAVPVLVDPPR